MPRNTKRSLGAERSTKDLHIIKLNVVDWEPPARRGKQEPKDKKRGSRSVTLDGNPDVECGGVLLSHTLSSAVPSPRPGLSFRVRKGTGRLTWAMTTAKPIQRPTGRTGGRQRNQPRFRSWRSGNRTTDASKTLHRYRHRDHKKQRSLPSNEKPPQDETQPTTKERVGKCAAFAR